MTNELKREKELEFKIQVQMEKARIRDLQTNLMKLAVGNPNRSEASMQRTFEVVAKLEDTYNGIEERFRIIFGL